MTPTWWKHCTLCLQDYFCHCWWENCSVSLLSSLSTSAHSEMPKANHSMADQRSWRCCCGSALNLVAWTTLWALPKSTVQVPSSVCCLYTCETEEQESVYGLLERKCQDPCSKPEFVRLLWVLNSMERSFGNMRKDNFTAMMRPVTLWTNQSLKLK